MNNIKAIFLKQMRSMIKSPTLLGTGIAFVIMALVMTFLMGPERECSECIPAYVCETCLRENPLHSLPNHSVTGMFTVMFIGMMVMGSSSGLVQEDKTTHNLRFMTMAGMKPHQYLLGTGVALFIVSFAILFLFAMVGRYFGFDTLHFLAITSAGTLVSILFGIAGGLSKMPALVGPLSMVFGMGPMFSQFNERLANFLHFTYTQQASLGIYHIGKGEYALLRNYTIIGITGLVIIFAFVWMHRKGELRW
jgi:hypothetical protein